MVCRSFRTDAFPMCRFMRGEFQIVRLPAYNLGRSKAEKVDLLTSVA